MNRWNLLSITILISLSVFDSESTQKETLAVFLIFLVVMTISVHLLTLWDFVKRNKSSGNGMLNLSPTIGAPTSAVKTEANSVLVRLDTKQVVDTTHVA
jgi:hypothetical protein